MFQASVWSARAPGLSVAVGFIGGWASEKARFWSGARADCNARTQRIGSRVRLGYAFCPAPDAARIHDRTAAAPQQNDHRRKSMPVRKALCAVLAIAAVLCAAGAAAQTYPSKPVRLIVTYPPGGSSDLMGARARAEALRALGPAGHHRVEARRGRLDRHGVRRAPARGRLQLRHRQPRAGGDQPAPLQVAVRHAAGFPPGVDDLHRSRTSWW